MSAKKWYCFRQAGNGHRRRRRHRHAGPATRVRWNIRWIIRWNIRLNIPWNIRWNIRRHAGPATRGVDRQGQTRRNAHGRGREAARQHARLAGPGAAPRRRALDGALAADAVGGGVGDGRRRCTRRWLPCDRSAFFCFLFGNSSAHADGRAPRAGLLRRARSV